ncbi:MAG: hypothetical protein AAFP77_16140 [Bacteroidota bacterium]
MMITVVLVGLAGFFNGVCDKLQFHFKRSFAKDWNPFYWDPQISWKNKYKNQDPKQGPAFLGSTTFLVAFTDAWHLSKLIQMACFRLAIVLLFAKPVVWSTIAYLVLWIIQAGGFHLVYTLLNQKESN